jgi:hypothetical protein
MLRKRLVNGLLALGFAGASVLGVAVSPASAATPVSPAVGVTSASASTTSLPPKATAQDKPTVGKAGKKAMPPKSKSSGGATTLSACSTTCFYYAGAMRSNATAIDGVQVNMGVYKPTKDSKAAHTLGEIAVEKDTSAGVTQIVEVGYTVDSTLNGGSSDPFLFVYHWVNGSSTCYNGCGFVHYASATLTPGDNISSQIGTQSWYGVQYNDHAWWIRANGQWIGYFPDSVWTGASPSVTTFTNTTYQQVFGEVAGTDTTTCTQMGNGTKPTATVNAARMGSLNKMVGGTATLDTYTSNFQTDPTRWVYYARSGSTFDYGGGC